MRIDSSHNVRPFEHAIRRHKEKDLLEMIGKDVGRKISPLRLQQLAQQHHYRPLMRAFEAKAHMAVIENVPMNEKKLIQAAFFIETKMQERIARGQFYFPKSSELPCPIQYDPSSQRAYILCQGRKAKIATCKHKSVKLGLEYSVDQPQRIAYAIGKDKIEKEVQNLQRLASCAGVLHSKAILSRFLPSQKEEVTIIYPYFTPGPLQNSFIRNLQERQKVTIAHETLLGLQSLHERDLIHRNLSPESIFISQNGMNVEAVLARVRHTKSRVDTLEKTANENHRYIAPEELSDRAQRNPKISEIFSLGTIFYELFYGEKIPWIQNRLLPEWVTSSDHTRQKERLKATFKAQIKAFRHANREYLNQQGESNLVNYKLMINKMVHSNPAKRPSLQQIISSFA